MQRSILGVVSFFIICQPDRGKPNAHILHDLFTELKSQFFQDYANHQPET